MNCKFQALPYLINHVSVDRADDTRGEIDPWIAIKTLAFSSVRMTCFICKVGGSHTWRGIFNTTQCDQMTCVIIPVILFLCEDKKPQLQTLWYSVKYQKLKLAQFYCRLLA
jgi:hypothetical protein